MRRVIIQALATVRYPVRPGAQGTVLVQPPEEGDRDAEDGNLRPLDVIPRPQARAGPQPAAAGHRPGRGVDPDRPRAGIPDRRPAGRLGGRSWAESVAPTAAHLQLAGEHRVPATLLRSVPGDSDQWFTVRFAWVKARWAVPHGPVRTGYVQAPVGSRAGSTVQVWLDRSGRPTAAAVAAQPDPGLGPHDGCPRACRAGAAAAGHDGNPRPHHGPAAAGQLGTGVVGDRAPVDPAPPLTSRPHRLTEAPGCRPGPEPCSTTARPGPCRTTARPMPTPPSDLCTSPPASSPRRPGTCGPGDGDRSPCLP